METGLSFPKKNIEGLIWLTIASTRFVAAVRLLSDEANIMCKKEKNRYMANNWNIPGWLEKEVRERDKKCVYCNVEFTPVNVSQKTAASWEYIINDATIITKENIALCGCSCNSSKDQKKLFEWFQLKYCNDRGINSDTVASIVKRAIKNGL